ncbi:MAG: aldose 1-epimerase family protein [Ruminococcaceae bacterium]|nr:aldose 1-epimerase family protein [Oscillospiraceae bacterium]
MIHYIENEYLKIGVKEFGCELTSVYSKVNNCEYLWQGDPAYWSGQSPILFPIVGRLIDDKYSLDGKEYEMPKHGFARKTDWFFEGADASSMKFRLSETEETLAIYPYHFDVIVKFTLDGNKLIVSHDIVNKNDNVMYASLGAHPAFNCEIGDRLVFDLPETLETEKIDLVKSLRMPETIPVLNNETDIIITKDIFNEDALILHGIKSENITLISDKHDRKVKFNLGNAPYLGIWAKPGAPYVCIEPWCGVNDSYEKKDDFSQKDGINAINAGETYNFTWYAVIE